MTPSFEDLLHAVLREIVKPLHLEYLRETQYGFQRGSQLVTHARQELALSTRRAFGVIPRASQFALQFNLCGDLARVQDDLVSLLALVCGAQNETLSAHVQPHPPPVLVPHPVARPHGRLPRRSAPNLLDRQPPVLRMHGLGPTADCILGRVAECVGDRWTHVPAASELVGDDDHVGRSVEDRAERQLSLGQLLLDPVTVRNVQRVAEYVSRDTIDVLDSQDRFEPHPVPVLASDAIARTSQVRGAALERLARLRNDSVEVVRVDALGPQVLVPHHLLGGVSEDSLEVRADERRSQVLGIAPKDDYGTALYQLLEKPPRLIELGLTSIQQSTRGSDLPPEPADLVVRWRHRKPILALVDAARVLLQPLYALHDSTSEHRHRDETSEQTEKTSARDGEQRDLLCPVDVAGADRQEPVLLLTHCAQLHAQLIHSGFRLREEFVSTDGLRPVDQTDHLAHNRQFFVREFLYTSGALFLLEVALDEVAQPLESGRQLVRRALVGLEERLIPRQKKAARPGLRVEQRPDHLLDLVSHLDGVRDPFP